MYLTLKMLSELKIFAIQVENPSPSELLLLLLLDCHYLKPCLLSVLMLLIQKPLPAE